MQVSVEFGLYSKHGSPMLATTPMDYGTKIQKTQTLEEEQPTLFI